MLAEIGHRDIDDGGRQDGRHGAYHHRGQDQPFVAGAVSLAQLFERRHYSLWLRSLRVNFSGIPITGFASSFEKSTNQQLQGSITGLPEGFIYCMTAIHTEPQGPEVSFAAQPMSQ